MWPTKVEFDWLLAKIGLKITSYFVYWLVWKNKIAKYWLPEHNKGTTPD